MSGIVVTVLAASVLALAIIVVLLWLDLRDLKTSVCFLKTREFHLSAAVERLAKKGEQNEYR